MPWYICPNCKQRSVDIDGVEGLKAEIYRANERFLIETVFRVARMVALKEISADKDYLSRLTHDLIERTVGVCQQQVCLYQVRPFL